MKSLPRVVVFHLDVLVNKDAVPAEHVADFLLDVMRDEVTVVIATNKTAHQANQVLAALDPKFATLGAPNARGIILVVCNAETLGQRNVLIYAMEYGETRRFHDVVVVGRHYERDFATAHAQGCRLALFVCEATSRNEIRLMARHPRGFVAYRLEDIIAILKTPL